MQARNTALPSTGVEPSAQPPTIRQRNTAVPGAAPAPRPHREPQPQPQPQPEHVEPNAGGTREPEPEPGPAAVATATVPAQHLQTARLRLDNAIAIAAAEERYAAATSTAAAHNLARAMAVAAHTTTVPPDRAANAGARVAAASVGGAAPPQLPQRDRGEPDEVDAARTITAFDAPRPQPAHGARGTAYTLAFLGASGTADPPVRRAASPPASAKAMGQAPRRLVAAPEWRYHGRDRSVGGDYGDYE
jgi:hypothetical protein